MTNQAKFDEFKSEVVGFAATVVMPIMRTFNDINWSSELPSMAARSHTYRATIMDGHHATSFKRLEDGLKASNTTALELETLIDACIRNLERVAKMIDHVRHDVNEIPECAYFKETPMYATMEDLGVASVDALTKAEGLKWTVQIVADLTRPHNHQVTLN